MNISNRQTLRFRAQIDYLDRIIYIRRDDRDREAIRKSYVNSLRAAYV